MQVHPVTPSFWRLAKAVLCKDQYARLCRMNQGFKIVHIHSLDDPLHILMQGAGLACYDLCYRNETLTCACPDACRSPPHLRCKHMCFLIVLMGKGGIQALQGDSQALQQAMRTAAHTIAVWARQQAAKHKPHAHRMQDDCPICLLELGQLPHCTKCADCSNHFHLACICTWLRVNSRCPLCRSTDWPAHH